MDNERTPYRKVHKQNTPVRRCRFQLSSEISKSDVHDNQNQPEKRLACASFGLLVNIAGSYNFVAVRQQTAGLAPSQHT